MGQVKNIPHPVEAPADERCSVLIDLLKEYLERARDGEFRSIVLCAVSTDGMAIPSSSNLDPSDTSDIIACLAVLQHDLMAART